MSFKAKLTLALISLTLFSPASAPAMTVEDFARLNSDDESTYVALLVESAAQILRANGHPDQATKAITYFKEPGKFGGVQQFAARLQTIDSLNKRNAINPNNRAPLLQIEDAMATVLKEQDIDVPAKSLLASMKDFRPSGPLRQHAFGP